MRKIAVPLLVGLLLATSLGATEDESWDDLFLGWEQEPAMDYAGWTLASIQSAASRAFSSMAPDKPALAAVWEFPVGIALLLVQHEVAGHGGRAREYDLGPSYGFSLDLSAFTDIDLPPPTNEVGAALSGAGVESDQVLARRIYLDLYGPDGVDGAKLPLAMMAQLDLTLYVLGTAKPDDQDFLEEGSDMVLYLSFRQAARRGIPASEVWEDDYVPDVDDPLLDDDYDAMRLAALWNLLDPSLVAAGVGYFKDRIADGHVRVRAPFFEIGEHYRLGFGTRATLGPQWVSRILDVHLGAPWAAVNLWIRDLDSNLDRTWGTGLRLHQLRLGSRVRLSLEGEIWDEPRAREAIYVGDGWYALGEVDLDLGERFGISAKAGSKSRGLVPGLPLDEGGFAGFGLRAKW